MNDSPYFSDALALLKDLIKTQSFSREEHVTADLIERFFISNGVTPHRYMNNVWAFSDNYDSSKPTLLLNSHHDTVKPNRDWTKDPFSPDVEDGKLYGLGSNDAGASLVSLIACFLTVCKQKLPFNIIMAATAEEEVAGQNGIEVTVPKLGTIDFAIVGEPTTLHMAVAERGLMVLDCTVYGKSGHAARTIGINAIEKAIPCLEWFRTFSFPKVSETLGIVKMSVTQINAGTQHNVIPDRCTFVVDIRLNDCYTHQEVFDIIKESCGCEISARSMRLKPSAVPLNHPLVQAANALGIPTFASPTMSDQALLNVPSIKIGPGMSERSHTADEYIELTELNNGIATYIALIHQLRDIYETLG